jgi:nucleoid DNA-binding protein
MVMRKDNKIAFNFFVRTIAASEDVTISLADRMIRAIFDQVAAYVETGSSVSIPGFGKFEELKHAPRKGTNPQTGKLIDIPASSSVKFSMAQKLKEAMNKK